MFFLAYVIIPVSSRSPAEAIRAPLAPFQAGMRGEVPDSWLAFQDETDELRQLHEAQITFTVNDTGGMQIEGYTDIFHLDDRAVRSGTCQRL